MGWEFKEGVWASGQPYQRWIFRLAAYNFETFVESFDGGQTWAIMHGKKQCPLKEAQTRALKAWLVKRRAEIAQVEAALEELTNPLPT